MDYVEKMGGFWLHEWVVFSWLGFGQVFQLIRYGNLFGAIYLT